jgi:hypothetical protein
LDRGFWRWSPQQIAADVFADSHSIRPYSAYRDEIDTLVRVLTQ